MTRVRDAVADGDDVARFVPEKWSETVVGGAAVESQGAPPAGAGGASWSQVPG